MKQFSTALLVFSGLLMAAGSSAQDLERGKTVYDARCVICHGPEGDGMGLVGIVHRAQQNGLVTAIYPRDFTGGVFKFRSTPSGQLPTDDDLMRIVTQGISRSGMPSHSDVPEADRRAVIEYIKTFSDRWERDGPGEPLAIADAPADVGSAESIERGRVVYDTMRCALCHGDTGRGDGSSSEGLQDSWGDLIVPFDFTSGPVKGGSTPEMIYRTFMTGLDGTPMPSYQDALPDERDRWDLVSFCLSLMRGDQESQ